MNLQRYTPDYRLQGASRTGAHLVQGTGEARSGVKRAAMSGSLVRSVSKTIGYEARESRDTLGLVGIGGTGSERPLPALGQRSHLTHQCLPVAHVAIRSALAQLALGTQHQPNRGNLLPRA